MGLQYIDRQMLVRMLQSGCAELEKNKDRVDSLNVFPVPDGDTGTNMYLTLASAVREAEKSNPNAGSVGKAISMGALMGARGNSGVILSQIFRGIARALDDLPQIDAQQWANAIQAGSDTAYKAVMKPVEGTMLTVVREIARVAVLTAAETDDIIPVMHESLEAGKKILLRTPQMLPILKEAGVVDAGGQGLIYFMEGMEAALTGGEVVRSVPMDSRAAAPVLSESAETGVLDFNYCTETLLKGRGLSVDRLRDELTPLGESLLVVGESDMVKVHIHSNHPGKVLEICLQWGTLHDIKIDNLAEQVDENSDAGTAAAAEPARKKVGIVAVSQGDGWNKILSSLGVDQIVEGGQTMNPSTEDLLNAVNQVNAETIIILPNNKNIILAAKQAKEISEKPVEVVPTSSTTQAIAALVAYEEDADPAELAKAMMEETSRVKTGEVTVAVRDSKVNGLDIREGDVIGLIDDVIKLTGPNAEEVVLQILADIAPDGDLITLYYGKDITEDQAESIREKVESAYPEHDVELHYGGQPYYQFVMSVE